MKPTKTVMLIALCAIVFACQDTSEEQETGDVFLVQQISEAKLFFEEEVEGLASFSDARELGSKSRKNTKRDLDWAQAYRKELSFGPALVVPVLYQEKRYAPINQDFIYTLEQASYALIYRDEDKKHHFEMVTSIPDKTMEESSEAFTGIVLVENWAGDFVRGFRHEDGQVLDISEHEAESSGRILVDDCQSETTHWYTCSAIVGVWNWECHYDYSETVEVCESAPTYYYGGGSSGCWSCGDGSDYDPNSGLAGYTKPGDKPQTADELCGLGKVFDDETGECVNDCGIGYTLNERGKCVSAGISISTYLTPINSTDDISVPYDGMRAYDKHGVVYTYSAVLNTWLMPEIQTISQSGQFEINTPTPVTESSLVMTMVPIALAEPTFVGELVLAGTVIVVGVIYVYEMSEYMDKAQEEDKQHCIKLYSDLCVGKYSYKSMPCSSCLQFCNTQGYWDFANCPLTP